MLVPAHLIDSRCNTDPQPAIREQVAKARFHGGCLSYMHDDLVGAHRLWEQAIDPPTVWVLVGLAPILAALGDIEGGVRLLHRAAAIGHEPAPIYAGALLSDRDDRAPFVEALVTVVDDGDSDAANVLGVVSLQYGHTQTPRQWWALSLELNDASAAVLLAIADAQ